MTGDWFVASTLSQLLLTDSLKWIVFNFFSFGGETGTKQTKHMLANVYINYSKGENLFFGSQV